MKRGSEKLRSRSGEECERLAMVSDKKASFTSCLGDCVAFDADGGVSRIGTCG